METFMLSRENFLRLLFQMRKAQKDLAERPSEALRIRTRNLEQMVDDELFQLDAHFDLGL